MPFRHICINLMGWGGLEPPMLRVCLIYSQVPSPLGNQPKKLRVWDLNPRPSGYEPDELPNCYQPAMPPRRDSNPRFADLESAVLSHSTTGRKNVGKCSLSACPTLLTIILYFKFSLSFRQIINTLFEI